MSSFLAVRWNIILSLALGIVAAVLFIAFLTGANIPFASGGLTSFIAMAVLGVGT